MSGLLQLNCLPPELLGKIFGHLTAPDILRLKLVGLAAGFPLILLTRSSIKVNRTFHDVVSDQPHLQHKCEPAAAGLLDYAPMTLFDRRTCLQKYRSRFDDLEPMNSSLPLGATGFCCEYETSGDIYVIHVTSTNTLHFCRPPSSSGSRPMKTWSLPLPFEPDHFVIHPPLDLIVITDNASASARDWVRGTYCV
jgi:hypothetical protein